MTDRPSLPIPAPIRWNPPGRLLVFLLSATSIWSLLAEFYHLCPMRDFTLYILIPTTLALIILALWDRLSGDHRLWRAVLIGAIGGFGAACAYDLFRIPFVVAATDKVGPLWLRLPLFKVFPHFGALILGHPFTPGQPESQFTLAEHLVGWLYHFSNGITFGIMYMTLIGDAARRTWWWAVALAVILELATLFTPYMTFFGIPLTTRFVVVTLTAHLLFGVALGLYAKLKATHWPQPAFQLGLHP